MLSVILECFSAEKYDGCPQPEIGEDLLWQPGRSGATGLGFEGKGSYPESEAGRDRVSESIVAYNERGGSDFPGRRDDPGSEAKQAYSAEIHGGLRYGVRGPGAFTGPSQRQG